MSEELTIRNSASNIKAIFIGGAIFWSPSVLLHAVRGYNFSGVDVLILTVLLPTIVMICVAYAQRLGVSAIRSRTSALWVMLGIWLLGPLCLMINASFSGGGFAREVGWLEVIVATISAPIFTFIMSTYDGTLLAVLIISGWLLMRVLRGGPVERANV
jgi:hypothetical protein